MQPATAFLDKIINAIADPVFVKDDQRRFVLVNDALCATVGRPRHELLGKCDEDFLAAEPAAVCRTADEKVLTTGERSLSEEPMPGGASSEMRTLTVRKTRFVDDRGERFLVGVLHDVTERRQAGRALAASELRYRCLFESAKDGILILDAESAKIVDVNPYLTTVTGYTRAEFLDKCIWEIGPFKDTAASKASFAELRREDYVRYDDLPLQCRDGRTIAVEFVSNVYRVDNQKVIQCNIRDITARKRADNEHEQLIERLRLSQKMEAIGSLAGGIAHDFNNLLCVILSCVGFVIDGVSTGERMQEDLLDIKVAAERAAALTRQLLAFGRKQVMQPIALSLNEAATGLEKMLRRVLGEDIELVQRLAPDLGLTLADPSQLEQVIMNLVVNARDAMPQGGKITIETANIEIDAAHAALHVPLLPGSYVLLAISDTGCGMDEQTKSKIFEPFFTTKEKGKGTGLGLATVYGIVKQSGGYIWAYSEPGEGTTFKIYLRRELSGTARVAARAQASPPQCTGTETILVVEDEEALRKIAMRSLEAAGYTVLTATDGEQALEAYGQSAREIHLLLTDVVMPRMGGRTLAQHLSKDRPELKVIYTSGYTDSAIAHHGILEAGMHFLGKPFTPEDLARKVRDVLDEGQRGTPREPLPAGQGARDGDSDGVEQERLPVLTADLRAKLRTAVLAARYDTILELIEAHRAVDPRGAASLRKMAERFDYSGLRDLVGRDQGESP